MKKDQYGISLTFYAVLAFVFVILGQTLLGGLLLGFVIVAQKDNWLTRQVMQAFFLSLLSGIWNEIDAFFSGFVSVNYKIPVVGEYLGKFTSAGVDFIDALVGLAILVFAIIGLVKVMKGKEAKIPLLHALAEKVCGTDTVTE